MARPKIALVVGHGVKPDGTHDPGATNPDGANEHHLNDRVAKAALAIFERADVDVVYEEVEESDPNYVGSTRKVNASGADVCVSVHHDWYKAPEGLFVLYVSDEGRKLAARIRNRAAALDMTLRDNQKRTDLYILKNTTMACVIVEAGRVRRTTVAEVKERGRAIAEGTLLYLGVEIPAVVPPEPEKVRWAPASSEEVGALYETHTLAHREYAIKRMHGGILDARWNRNAGVALIRSLQRALGLKVDGLFGAETGRAVRVWQKAHGYSPTGIVTKRLYNEIVFGG